MKTNMELHYENWKVLQTRTKLAYYYRKYWLYPKINKFFQKKKTLDIGCGIGDLLNFNNEIIGCDINNYAIEYCKKQNLKVYQIENNILPFDNNSFEAISLDQVIEHLYDPTHLINEIKRILIKSGILIIGVPGTKGFALYSDHKVHYEEKNLVTLFEKEGFKFTKSFCTPLNWKFTSKYIRQYSLYCIFFNIN